MWPIIKNLGRSVKEWYDREGMPVDPPDERVTERDAIDMAVNATAALVAASLKGQLIGEKTEDIAFMVPGTLRHVWRQAFGDGKPCFERLESIDDARKLLDAAIEYTQKTF